MRGTLNQPEIHVFPAWSNWWSSLIMLFSSKTDLV